MEKISLVKEEKETFNWDIPSGLSVNKFIKTPHHVKIYSHEIYASSLYSLYCGISPEVLQFSKDLEDGKIYKFRISNLTENSALGYTDSGQKIGRAHV